MGFRETLSRLDVRGMIFVEIFAQPFSWSIPGAAFAAPIIASDPRPRVP
jgi:hypothetical protein